MLNDLTKGSRIDNKIGRAYQIPCKYSVDPRGSNEIGYRLYQNQFPKIVSKF
jgi:hypothetical protein